MSALQTLRQARWITCLVLVWFALFIGTAVASPLVKPVAGQMVCTAMGGMKMVTDGEDGNAAHPRASMDCPLCAPLLAPPDPERCAGERPSALAHVLRTIPSAHIAWLTRSPLPPRGPPALS